MFSFKKMNKKFLKYLDTQQLSWESTQKEEYIIIVPQEQNALNRERNRTWEVRLKSRLLTTRPFVHLNI